MTTTQISRYNHLMGEDSCYLSPAEKQELLLLSHLMRREAPRYQNEGV